MPANGWTNLLLVLLDGIGTVLFAYAVLVGIGKVTVPQGRIWGSAVRMSRSRFGLYFGLLGLAFGLTMHLVLHERDNSAFLAIIAVPALLSTVLIIGWAVMARTAG